MLTYKNPMLGNWLHYNHPEAQAVYAGKEQVVVGHEQIQIGSDENGPIFADGEPIYGDGDDLFGVDWQEAWGTAPSEEDLEIWEDPTPPLPIVTIEGVAQNFKGARVSANDSLYHLMASVAIPMIAFAGFTEASANEAGADFMDAHKDAINAFLLAGGHPSKALKLLESIQAKQADFDWLATVLPNTGGKTILTGIFEPTLNPPT